MNFHCLSERVAESTWNMMADGVKYLNGDSLIFRIVTSILGKRMLRTHHAIRPSSFSDPPEAATILLARPTTKKKEISDGILPDLMIRFPREMKQSMTMHCRRRPIRSVEITSPFNAIRLAGQGSRYISGRWRKIRTIASGWGVNAVFSQGNF